MDTDRRLFLRSVLRFVVCGLLVVSGLAAPAASQAVRLAPDVPALRAAARTSIDEPLRRPAAGRYDVVALRVEFQPDTTRFTTGDGTFEGDLFGDGLEPAIDPLPHNAGYFQAHLDFLQDYVERVSDGIVDVETHLIPEVIRLPHQMAQYAPTGPDAASDAELAKLAAIVADAWSAADAQSSFDMSGFDPDKTALVLFHAGVGRDIELIGTTLDKTPQDLPSIFFNDQALTRLVGSDLPAFNGFPIRHSLIIPRTETRRAMDFIADEPFLLELSINGMLAASFFNYLGVPDLFDTETGESAIGPFGLMDPQGIFAYRGLFPPEPMAWTKLYLGWTDPVRLDRGVPQTVALEAASVAGLSESARVLISEAEYFMVENRFRDPEDDGLTLRVWRDGAVVEQHVENGDPEFNNDVVDGFIGGVVVGVDNYDWALPGGLDEDDNELNGGILIWHVDERRLRAGFADNAVNVGTETRAIDLEEADGAQDIGFPSAGIFGPQAELGSPFDFYYEGNPVSVLLTGGNEVRLYENRFGPTTYPGSETNGGGPSFIVLEDFSAPGAEMSFQYSQEGAHGVEPMALSGVEINATFGVGSMVSGMADVLGVFYSDAGHRVTWVGADSAGTTSLVAPVTGSETSILKRENGSYVIDVFLLDGTVPSIPLPDDVSSLVPASALVRTTTDGEAAYHLLMKDADETVLVSATFDEVTVRDAGGAVSLAAQRSAGGSQPIVVGRSGVSFASADWQYDILDTERIGQAVFGRDAGGLMGAIPVTSSGELLLLGSDGETVMVNVPGRASRFGAAAADTLSAYPVLADVDGDERLDVLAAYGSQLFAFSQSGAVAANFPIRVPGPLAAQPLIVEFGESLVIVAASANGYIYAYDVAEPRRPLPGFPLEVGGSVLATPTFLNTQTLLAISESGGVKAWRLTAVTDVLWGQLYGGPDNASFALAEFDDAPEEPAGGLIDESETYNWPNPIRDGSTHLRIATMRDAEVRIRIIDAAGQLVDDVEIGHIRGGIPTEVVWQAAGVQSGLYIARFTATAADGETETKLVKMAVVK